MPEVQELEVFLRGGVVEVPRQRFGPVSVEIVKLSFDVLQGNGGVPELVSRLVVMTGIRG